MIYPWLEPVEAEFIERLERGRLAHAFLLSGPANSGKRELAVQLLASIMCLQDSYPSCGDCRSCQLLKSGAHPDGHVLTFEENTKTGVMRKELVIDQVRRLIASLYLTNTISRRKAALIYPVEAMNRHTANALLKTLEEPPGETVLVLVSDDPARLPATIRSRCQNLHVRLPDTAVALEWLHSNGATDRKAARLALDAAAGSPPAALRMLNDGSMEQYRLVNETLNQLDEGTGDPGTAVTALAEVDPSRLWSWLSLRAAGETRKAAEQGHEARTLSRLQSEADRNRYLVSTPVRKDLLLQDWLIQWARINA